MKLFYESVNGKELKIMHLKESINFFLNTNLHPITRKNLQKFYTSFKELNKYHIVPSSLTTNVNELYFSVMRSHNPNPTTLDFFQIARNCELCNWIIHLRSDIRGFHLKTPKLNENYNNNNLSFSFRPLLKTPPKKQNKSANNDISNENNNRNYNNNVESTVKKIIEDKNNELKQQNFRKNIINEKFLGYSCLKCNKQFQRKGNLENHLKTFHNLNEVDATYFMRYCACKSYFETNIQSNINNKKRTRESVCEDEHERKKKVIFLE